MLQKRITLTRSSYSWFLIFPGIKCNFFSLGLKEGQGLRHIAAHAYPKFTEVPPEGEGVPCLFTFSQNGAISSNAVVRSSKEEFVFNFKTCGVYFISAIMVPVRWLLWVWLEETTTRNQSWPKIYFPSLNVCNRLQIMFTLCSDCLFIECVCIVSQYKIKSYAMQWIKSRSRDIL